METLGLVPIIRAAGPDVARSAAGRAAAEAVWVPTALLPRYGAHWCTEDDHSVVADFAVGDEQVRVAFSSTALSGWSSASKLPMGAPAGASRSNRVPAC